MRNASIDVTPRITSLWRFISRRHVLGRTDRRECGGVYSYILDEREIIGVRFKDAKKNDFPQWVSEWVCGGGVRCKSATVLPTRRWTAAVGQHFSSPCIGRAHSPSCGLANATVHKVTIKSRPSLEIWNCFQYGWRSGEREGERELTAWVARVSQPFLLAIYCYEMTIADVVKGGTIYYLYPTPLDNGIVPPLPLCVSVSLYLYPISSFLPPLTSQYTLRPYS